MRVSDSMVFSSVQRNTSAAQRGSSRPAARATSQRGSRSPRTTRRRAARAVRLDRVLAELDSAAQTRQTVRADLTVAEAGLRNGIQTIEAAKDLATQMSNGSSSAVDRARPRWLWTATSRSSAAWRIRAWTDGRYVFGGTRDGSEPYPAAGGYLGGQNSRMVQIAPGASFDSAVVGSQSFGDYRHRVPGARGLRDSAAQQRPRRDPGRPGHAPGQLNSMIPNLTALGTRIQVLDSMDSLTASNKLAIRSSAARSWTATSPS
jgi:hypothetical protein